MSNDNGNNKLVISLEIGENLQKAIADINKIVEKENARCRNRSFMPGNEIQYAFGINFEKIIEEFGKEVRRNISGKDGKTLVDIKITQGERTT